MKVTKTDLKGVLIIETDYFEDARGWFTESYNKDRFCKAGIDANFVQDNHSLSMQKGVLRGIHFQINPKAQSKLVRCTRGKILDVIVDLKKGSDTFKKCIYIELSESNRRQVFIPKGYGHAFITLTDNVEVQYKVDEYYSKAHDRSIRYDDPELAINWGVLEPLVSDKDKSAPLLKDSDVNFTIKVLVTGVRGQLGHDVLKRLQALGIEAVGVDKEDFDITDTKQTEEYILSYKPDVVVHCSAYTAVDKAEDEKDLCYQVNVIGTANIVNACKQIDAKLIYISTDYVFDGSGTLPFAEDSIPSALNHYGLTKAQGEEIVKQNMQRFFIIRTSWVFGLNGHNFVKTMLRLADTRTEIHVVDDQVGSPTYTQDLAILVCDMLQTAKYGIYHASNEGYCSWYEFAVEIFRLANKDIKVIPIKTHQYPSKAIRPLNSRLSKQRLDEEGFRRLPNWKDALKRYLKELGIIRQ